MDFINKLNWLNAQVWGYKAVDWIQAFGTLILVFIGLRVTARLGFRILEKMTRAMPEASEFIRKSQEQAKPWLFLAVALLVSLQRFTLPEKIGFFCNLTLSAIILGQILNVFSVGVRYFFEKSTKGNTGRIKSINKNLASVAILALWCLSFLILLDNFGFNVATLIAGLGVGGIAIGLALQSVLGDMFASFVIGLDQPFEMGDFIIVDSFMGTVELIGLKTTRIRSISGELLVFSNNDLVNSRIRNYKKMNERRVVFQIGVTYDTDQKILEELPTLITQIIEGIQRARFDRAHLKTFGAFSLDYEIAYYVLSPEYSDYMNVQQEMNFKIRRLFLEKGIEFAFPTTTIDYPQAKPEEPQTAPQ